MSELQKRLQTSRLPPMPPPGVGKSKKGFGRGKRDYTPTSWETYFDVMHHVEVDGNKFCMYEVGKEGPVCLFLHGGGFSALSWSLLSKDLVTSVKCRCVAVDLRGHGDTYTSADDNLAIDILADDVGKVVKARYGEETPPIILIGHSMGGAIAVHVAERQLIPSLLALAVIDVVEGTALDALNTMQTFLKNRPTTFKDMEYAIEWSVRTGHIRNIDSAKISMLGQLKKCDTHETASSEYLETVSSKHDTICEESDGEDQKHKDDVQQTSHTVENPAPSNTPGNSTRDKQTSSDSPSTQHTDFKKPDSKATGGYTWRIDLSKTEPYWKGWFKGLSALFLSCTVPKLLLLAGVDRLDKDLTLGQMQGKFQMQVLPQCGHAVHEDVPEKVSDVLCTFMVRHKFAEPNGGFQKTVPCC